MVLNILLAIYMLMKNMSFLIEDEDVYLKYTEIWNKITKLLQKLL